jgi:hypothetical protein
MLSYYKALAGWINKARYILQFPLHLLDLDTLLDSTAEEAVEQRILTVGRKKENFLASIEDFKALFA